jgi:hypothetical protein
MIDPILTLAHTVQSNKGVFAILLGSGISRPAGVPTGWEVTLDLVSRLAALQNENPAPDPEAWYRATYGSPPEYSALMQALGGSPSERRAILHSLFEPTEEEREQGLKVPTVAHRSIARLVAGGYVRVIVTTNFDRLVETALQDEGIVATVISTADAIKGAAPLVHQRCVVFKLHGDYLDDRIKNTEDELASYDPELNAYLDRVLDEFGLIVCGWSGEWDPALRAAIERSPNRRYTTFWTARRDPPAKAQKLIVLRGARPITIKSADDFFGELADKVQSLEEMNAPAPSSVGAAVASIKRYASDPVHRIRFHDLLMDEAARVNARVMEEPVQGVTPDKSSIRGRISRFEADTELLRTLLYHAAFWAEEHHYNTIKRTVSTLVPPDVGSGFNAWLRMMAYPATLGFYTAGLGAMAGGNYGLLLGLTRLHFGARRKPKEALPGLTASWVLEQDVAALIDDQRWYFPLSEHFSRRIFASQSSSQDFDRFTEVDRLEVLFALCDIDRHIAAGSSSFGVLYGRFAARHHDSAYSALFEEAAREGEAWAPFKGGMFGGDVARFEQVKAVFTEKLKQDANRWW